MIPLLKPLLIAGTKVCSECTDRKCMEAEQPYICEKLQKRFREVWGIPQEENK